MRRVILSYIPVAWCEHGPTGAPWVVWSVVFCAEGPRRAMRKHVRRLRHCHPSATYVLTRPEHVALRVGAEIENARRFYTHPE